MLKWFNAFFSFTLLVQYDDDDDDNVLVRRAPPAKVRCLKIYCCFF